jgi:ABC-type sugar transport system ATPase subunit
MKLEARNIAVRFGQAAVLRNVDLAVASGEMVGLIGHVAARAGQSARA